MRRGQICLILVSSFLTSLPSNAHAHVKWFSPYDLTGVPTQLEVAFNFNFVSLFALSALLLLAGAMIESLAAGKVLLRAVNRITAALEPNGDLLIRAACGFFLVSIWTLGGIILTPELKTSEQWISWFQLALAAGLLWRQTLVFTAGGLVALYAIALYNYGAFHLLDYPIFIGLAVYLALTGLQKSPFGIRPLDVLRVAAAITLMWASVEKWAYPQWSHPIIEAAPGMTLGFSREIFMQAAGVIEFALSFAMLLGPLVRRTAALILFAMFISAIGPFGKIDAIGHAPIIAAVVAIIADRKPGGAILTFDAWPAGSFLRSTAALFASYGAFLVAFVGSYYLLHAEIYEPMPLALCVCPSHKPGDTSPTSTTIPQPLSRNGPICQAVLASSGWWSRVRSPRDSSASKGATGYLSALKATDSCGVDLAGTPITQLPK